MLTLLGRAVTRTCSALTLLVIVVGVPTGLLRYVGKPLPAEMPRLSDIADAVTHPISDKLLIGTIAAVVWLLWLLLLASITVEVGAAARGITAPRPRVLRPTQGLAAVLVAGLTAGVLAPTAVAPLSPALGGSSAAPQSVVANVLAANGTATPKLTFVAYATPLHAQAPATGRVTLIIQGCRYEHTVVKNESLWRIAELCLGNPYRWPEIFKLNKGRHWPHVSGDTKLTNPNRIFPGWVLVLPDDATPPPAARPIDPPNSGRTATQPAVPTTPASPTPLQSPAVSLSAAAPSAIAPSVVPSTTATAAPAGTGTARQAATAPHPQPTSADASDGADEPPTEEHHGFVAVDGGFVTVALAAGLLFAVALAWRRRRHRYRPTPIDAVTLDDPDLAPPLAASTRLRHTLRRHRPDLLDAPVTGPTVREYTSAEVKPHLPAGPTGTDLAGVADLQASAGLGLHGPGASDAARGMLVASLTAGSPDDPDAEGQVVVPATTLATLLGVSAVDLPRIRRLTVTATTSDAIAEIEEEIIRRTRILTDHDVATITQLRQAHPLAEPLPQMLLLSDVPEPRQHQRLANAIRLGENVNIGAALIGAWPLGVTLTVAAEGASTGDPATSRVTVLDTEAATAVLTMLAEAHDDSPAVPASDSPPTTSAATYPPAAARAETDVLHPAPPADAAPSAEHVQVRVLGEPAVLGPDGNPMKGLRGKAIELLVYLAVHRDGATLADIMEALWPDASWRRAGQRLSTCVANLRNVLRAAHPTSAEPSPDSDAAEASGGTSKAARKPDPIPNTGSHYHLDSAFVQVDWWTVLDRYAQVATAEHDAARRHHLTAAVAAVTGALAEGQDYDWIDTDREHVRRRLIKVFAHAAQLNAERDPHQARQLYEQACQLDPLCEDLARSAMQAAAVLRDANGIRHRLATLRQALEDNDLDIEDTTEELADDLLAQLAPPHRTDRSPS